MAERSKKTNAIERRDPKASALDNRNRDVVLIHGVTDDGAGLKVLRARKNRVESGAVRPLKEGQPILGEVVSLRPRPNQPFICDVDVELPAPLDGAVRKDQGRGDAALSQPGVSSHKGPPQVASDKYRRNWETIYNAPKKSRLVN